MTEQDILNMLPPQTSTPFDMGAIASALHQKFQEEEKTLLWANKQLQKDIIDARIEELEKVPVFQLPHETRESIAERIEELKKER